MTNLFLVQVGSKYYMDLIENYVLLSEIQILLSVLYFCLWNLATASVKPGQGDIRASTGDV